MFLLGDFLTNFCLHIRVCKAEYIKRVLWHPYRKTDVTYLYDIVIFGNQGFVIMCEIKSFVKMN